MYICDVAKLVRIGPQENASALAIMKWDDKEETMLDMDSEMQRGSSTKKKKAAPVAHGQTARYDDDDDDNDDDDNDDDDDDDDDDMSP
ncbi:hypothetical protein TURU_121882 [Turdus rufiventris]|nr:hypothetical protein TURU_121882 [Turdus rufiventris]